ncbi:uncharacterized protein LOC131889952 [Tigriopus californicus]|uniref:uncharacterized protein LOC131889952 n=1 Tax=Tigriopus californicus TaxID=6832 RepID=UPI0027DA145D|nr:uncharacterized protein LOC131889952 [Tigriopus californicus]
MNLPSTGVLKTTLEHLLWITLFAYFAYQFIIQWKKFRSGETTVATSLSQETMFFFPDLIFCHKHGFKEPVQDHLGSESYFDNVLHPDVNLVFTKSSALGILPDHFQVRNLSTTYNGFCRVFHFSEGYEKRVWLKFQMNKSEEYFVFFMVPNTTFYLANHDFFQMPKMLDIQTSANVIIQPKKLSFETNCNDYREDERVVCLKDVVRENLTQSGIPCVPVPLEQTTNGYSDKICRDDKQAKELFEKIWPVVSNALNHPDCVVPCFQRSYDLAWLPMSGQSFEDVPNYHTLYVFFGTEFVQTQTRYVLMDFSAWLSNTGGLLGLLLGLSLYSIGTAIINRVFSLTFE